MVMKGAWKTVEAVMAGMIILLFAAALGATTLQASPRVPEQSYRALEAAYENGDLRRHAADMNCSAIESVISATGYLRGYGHSVQVCDELGSCCGQIPASGNVWVSSMVLAGHEQYQPAEVILYVYRLGG
jgi:hypothetical protein